MLSDSLSGVYNRRGFFARGAERIETNRELGVGTGVVFASLEGIRVVNQEHGYETGDEAIRRTGVALQSACDSDAVIGRIAGNVFAVCGTESTLPTDDPEVLERMVTDGMPGSTEKLALTIGIATRRPATTSTSTFSSPPRIAPCTSAGTATRLRSSDQVARSIPRD